jgi:DUF4097 and DUF4098 domain-containing protein YvlB
MRSLPQHPRRLAVPLLAAVALLAPAAARGQSRDAYRIDTTVAVGRDAAVDLSLISGDVIVTAASRDEVRIKAYSEVIPLRFEHVGNTVRVTTESGNYRRSGDQRMEVVVPFGTRVRAGTVSGNVSVRGVRGEIEASSVSGDATVEDVTRRASVSSVSGDARLRGVEGDVRARSVSGDVTIERVTGEVDAETVSGEVDVRGARSDRVHAQSVSGDLTYDGTISRDGHYDFQSHSGTVRLYVPSDAGISLTASSFSGSINSRMPMTMGPTRAQGGGRGRGQRMELSVNGGGARVSAQTFSGDIVIIDRASARPDNR